MVTANLNAPLMVGPTDNTLTCGVSGAENLSPVTDYQWTRNDGSTVGTTNILSPTSVGLSDAGIYTCHVTVRSGLLSNSIMRSASQIVMVQSELIITI